MTTSELAERKKELTECYTAEELADMYLKSEEQRTVEDKKSSEKLEELHAKLDELERKHKALLTEFDRVRQVGESANKIIDELSMDIRKEQKAGAALNVAVDVIMRKYVKLLEEK